MTEPMLNLEAFYETGLPIKTEIGTAHFLKVKDYPNYFFELQNVSMSKLEILNSFHKLNKDGSLDDSIQRFEGMTLFELAFTLPEYQESYQKIFAKVFRDENILYAINKNNFETYRKLIMNMNAQIEEEVNPNPEIQAAIERSKRVKSSKNNSKQTFASMLSSIVAHGTSYKEALELTIYQFYSQFRRIALIKDYETSILFATVSGETDKIPNWSEDINLLEPESHFMSQAEFGKTSSAID